MGNKTSTASFGGTPASISKPSKAFSSTVDAVNDAFLNAMAPRYVVYSRPASTQLLLHYQEDPFTGQVPGWSLVPTADLEDLIARLKAAPSKLKTEWAAEIGGDVLCDFVGPPAGDDAAHDVVGE